MTDPLPDLIQSLLQTVGDDHQAGAIGLAIVDGDRAYSGAYGRLLDPDGPPATVESAFHIASCSKAFVATSACLLEARGMWSLSDPIALYVPEFAPVDPWVAANCSIRDLLSMRTGLPRGSIAEWGINQELSKAERVSHVRHIRPVFPFRDQYTYLNLGYIAVSLAISRRVGTSYADFLRNTFFEPLGMTHTCSFDGKERQPAELVHPHMIIDGALKPVEELTGPNTEGSGRIYMSANDAVRWLRFNLGRGMVDGVRLAPEHIFDEIFAPHTMMRDPARRKLHSTTPTSSFAAYCLGWAATDHAGHKLVQHGGFGFGWRAQVALVPATGIGVAAFVSGNSPAQISLSYRILDALLDLPPRDWDRLARDEEAAELGDGPISASTSTQEIDRSVIYPDYLGTYDQDENGPVSIEAEGGHLTLRFGRARIYDARLTPVGPNRFSARLFNQTLRAGVADPYDEVRFERASGNVIALVCDFGRFVRAV